MKKIILTTLVMILVSCTTIVENVDKISVNSSFNKSKNEFLKVIKQNKKNDIDKFFIKGLRNNVILKEIKKYDFNDFLLIIPDDIEIVSNRKVKSLLLIRSSFCSSIFSLFLPTFDT
ncbi:hypothetical protein [Oceanivirga salmonicida]|uniref:hypothetical protein n=1 Tax=Oceanivirga salmonicida TaxID=1769291 RepID=UPI00082D4CD2|nr:hypothetical protein [Oceanivirga salmonicida]